MEKVLLVLTSPRKNGNSSYLCNLAKEYYKDADVLDLASEQLKGCIACDYCIKNYSCFTQDNTTKILNKMLEYDLVIMFCPVYFCGFDSHTKKLIDRSQYLYNTKKDEKGKIALVTVYGATKKDNYIGLENGMKYFAMALGKHFAGTLAFANCDAKGDIIKYSPKDKLFEFLTSLG